MLKVTHAMDSVKTIIQSLLISMGDLTNPQKKFILTLFSTLLVSCGRATFVNLSRYSQINERTYRRQYQRSFNFIKFNQKLIEQAIDSKSEVILAVIGYANPTAFGWRIAPAIALLFPKAERELMALIIFTTGVHQDQRKDWRCRQWQW